MPVRPGSGPDRLVTPLIWFVGHARPDRARRRSAGRFDGQFRSSGTLGAVRRKDLAAAGVERVPRTAGVRDGRPVLEDGRVLDVANVIWCTGFAPDFGWIDLPVFDEDGDPVHDRGVMDSEPGLYFVGLYFQYALASC